jgi:hypothetical protein
MWLMNNVKLKIKKLKVKYDLSSRPEGEILLYHGSSSTRMFRLCPWMDGHVCNCCAKSQEGGAITNQRMERMEKIPPSGRDDSTNEW